MRKALLHWGLKMCFKMILTVNRRKRKNGTADKPCGAMPKYLKKVDNLSFSFPVSEIMCIFAEKLNCYGKEISRPEG